MAPHELGIVRHVLLLCRDTPWVFARSIIPPGTFQQTGRRLATLGARPLGRILFSDRTLRRVQVHVSEIKPEHPLLRLAATCLEHQPRTAWARRSIFLLRNRPLLVNEVFLPEVFDG
jgi:chorismate--pyruvate lyase